MRAGALLFLLTGCLAAPADALDPGGQPDGGDAVAIRCVPGSTLDLAYVNRIAVTHGVSATVTLSGTAVFVNPGEDNIIVPQVTASAVGGDSAVIAGAEVNGGEAGMVLAPGEAKGALAESASAVVQARFVEAWNDTTSPLLEEAFVLSDVPPDGQELAGDLYVPILVQAGDYAFGILVTLVDDGTYAFGTPLDAARASATCE